MFILIAPNTPSIPIGGTLVSTLATITVTAAQVGTRQVVRLSKALGTNVTEVGEAFLGKLSI